MLFSVRGNTEFRQHTCELMNSHEGNACTYTKHMNFVSFQMFVFPFWNNTLQSGSENKVECTCGLTSVEAVAGEQTGGRVDACHGVSDVRGR